MELIILFLSFFLLCKIALPPAVLIAGGVLGGLACIGSWFRFMRTEMRMESRNKALILATLLIVVLGVLSSFIGYLAIFARIAMAVGVVELYKFLVSSRQGSNRS